MSLTEAEQEIKLSLLCQQVVRFCREESCDSKGFAANRHETATLLKCCLESSPFGENVTTARFHPLHGKEKRCTCTSLEAATCAAFCFCHFEVILSRIRQDRVNPPGFLRKKERTKWSCVGHRKTRVFFCYRKFRRRHGWTFDFKAKKKKKKKKKKNQSTVVQKLKESSNSGEPLQAFTLWAIDNGNFENICRQLSPRLRPCQVSLTCVGFTRHYL